MSYDADIGLHNRFCTAPISDCNVEHPLLHFKELVAVVGIEEYAILELAAGLALGGGDRLRSFVGVCDIDGEDFEHSDLAFSLLLKLFGTDLVVSKLEWRSLLQYLTKYGVFIETPSLKGEAGEDMVMRVATELREEDEEGGEDMDKYEEGKENDANDDDDENDSNDSNDDDDENDSNDSNDSIDSIDPTNPTTKPSPLHLSRAHALITDNPGHFFPPSLSLALYPHTYNSRVKHSCTQERHKVSKNTAIQTPKSGLVSWLREHEDREEGLVRLGLSGTCDCALCRRERGEKLLLTDLYDILKHLKGGEVRLERRNVV
jgi:hypothetical protein